MWIAAQRIRSSMKRWVVRYTWHWVIASRKLAASTNQLYTGIWSAICVLVVKFSLMTSCSVKMASLCSDSIRLAIKKVTIQVSFLLRRLRLRGEGERRGHPAPRQGACKAPWNPLLNSYLLKEKLQYVIISSGQLEAGGIKRCNSSAHLY